METIKLKTHVGDDGLLKLELPTGVTNRELEVLVIMQTLDEERIEESQREREDWEAFVNATYGSLADDPIESPAPLPLDVRDEIE
jgi:hypothetical protein